MIWTAAQFDLLKDWMETKKYENEVFLLPLGAATCACSLQMAGAGVSLPGARINVG